MQLSKEKDTQAIVSVGLACFSPSGRKLVQFPDECLTIYGISAPVGFLSGLSMTPLLVASSSKMIGSNGILF